MGWGGGIRMQMGEGKGMERTDLDGNKLEEEISRQRREKWKRIPV